MPAKTLARGSVTRTANKIRRKDRILSCARHIIATQGYDALTLSQLASDAEVTIPTLHNLLGKKSQIIEHLVGDVVLRIDDVLSRQEEDDPIAAIHLFTDALITLYAQDEVFYKAAFIAGERLKLFEHRTPGGIFMRSMRLAVQLCKDAKDKGFLRGEINTDCLAEHLFGCQRLARHDWMNNYIDLSSYKSRIVSGMFTVLAADAEAGFKERLIAEINALNPH
ncbi:MAG: TetR/AcrR family transcriptional regulator [Hellea sp.]